MFDPIMVEGMTKNGSADRSRQMRTALAPVKTRATEHPTLGGEAKIDAVLIEE